MWSILGFRNGIKKIVNDASIQHTDIKKVKCIVEMEICLWLKVFLFFFNSGIQSNYMFAGDTVKDSQTKKAGGSLD